MAINEINLMQVHKAFGARVIMQNLSMGIDAGEKIGLIGDNGTGKSTLLKIIAGVELFEEGVRSVRNGVRMGMLEQMPHFEPGTTVLQALQQAFEPLLEAIAGYEQAILQADVDADVYLHRIEALGGFEWMHQVESMALELGLPSLETDVSTLSGGYQKRVALAQLVLSRPDVYLLDEPTNHLDAQTVDWLELFMRETSSAVLVVTHDRYFLERAVKRMIELRDGVVRSYQGSYSDYLQARAEEEALQERYKHRRLQILKAELEWARKSPPARTTKQRARLDRAQAAQEEQERLRVKRGVAELEFGAAPPLGREVVAFEQVHYTLPNQRCLIRDFTFRLRAGERIGILGPNGAGKTTFLRLMQGEIKPTQGKVKIHNHTTFAYFDQYRTTLDLSKTIRENILPQGGDDVFLNDEKIHISSWLQKFAFRTETHNTTLDKLSGGERHRVALAQFLLKPANVLILDEPTNDLDILTLNVLEEALLAFQGSIVVVSHDRYFLDKIATGMIAFEAELEPAGTVSMIQGDYTTYTRLRLPDVEAQLFMQRQEQEARKQAQKQPKEKIKTNRFRGLNAHEQRELDGLPDVIEKQESVVQNLENALNDPNVWTTQREHAATLQHDREQAQHKLEQLYERWQTLSDKAAQAT